MFVVYLIYKKENGDYDNCFDLKFESMKGAEKGRETLRQLINSSLSEYIAICIYDEENDYTYEEFLKR